MRIGVTPVPRPPRYLPYAGPGPYQPWGWRGAGGSVGYPPPGSDPDYPPPAKRPPPFGNVPRRPFQGPYSGGRPIAPGGRGGLYGATTGGYGEGGRGWTIPNFSLPRIGGIRGGPRYTKASDGGGEGGTMWNQSPYTKAQNLFAGMAPMEAVALRRSKTGKLPAPKQAKRRYGRYGRIPLISRGVRSGKRLAAKAELMRMLGSLPSATTKAANPYAIDMWVKSMDEGVGSITEAVEALQELMQAGIPEESYGAVSEAIGELLGAIEEDEAADDAGAYDEEDAAEAAAEAAAAAAAYGYDEEEDGGYEQGYEQGYDPGYEQGGEVYDTEYAYAGDDGMGEVKALMPADDYDAAAEALTGEVLGRVYDHLGAQPAIKSVGFEAPYFNTHAPHGDRMAHLKAFDQYIRVGETRMEPQLMYHLQAATKAAMQEDSDGEGGLALAA